MVFFIIKRIHKKEINKKQSKAFLIVFFTEVLLKLRTSKNAPYIKSLVWGYGNYVNLFLFYVFKFG